MSLINQALRKAQRDRTPQRMQNPGAGPSAPVAPASGMKLGLVIGLVVAVALLLGLVAGLSLVLFKGNDAANVAQQTAAPPESTAATQNATAPPVEQAATTPANIDPVVPQNQPLAQTPPLEREAVPAVVEELRKAREAAEAKAAAEAEAAEKAAARAAAKPSQDIIEWLSHAQISGVKLSATDSKVILNGKSYAVGDYVNYSLGLKVMVIQENRILFIDKNGKKYMKRL